MNKAVLGITMENVRKHIESVLNLLQQKEDKII